MSWRAARVAFSQVAALQEALELPEPVAWALVRRGLGDPGAAREFMTSDGPLAPAEDLAGISEAADRLARAVRAGERIAVHGDYDCDGICSTAILVSALRGRGADVTSFLPSRFAEGYGVAESTVETLADRGARVLVCVDCGTSAIEALTRAVDLGMEPVVLDHHLAGGRRPPGILANPALGRPADDLPAAAGVVHMLVRALAGRLDGGGLAPDADACIDLVALATVADAVPLVGDNRRRVAQGLRAMRESPRPGIAALCAAASMEPRTVSARALGFTLAPCINAAGRLSHPDRALELLLAPDRETADPIAQELWALNAERREVEREIVDQAIAQVEAEPDEIRRAGVVVASGDGWHEGVVGIVASRLAERFERPAVVISRMGETGKGSGRSVPGVDLHALVGAAAGTLTRWGGHAGAVGLELPTAAIARFRDELITAAEGARAAIDRARVRTVDAVVGGPRPHARHRRGPRGPGALRPRQPAGAPGGARGRPRVAVAGGAGQAPPGAPALGRRPRPGDRLPHGRARARPRPRRAPRRRRLASRSSAGRAIVGPRVSVEALDVVGRAGPLPGQCAQACDAACPERLPLADLRALVEGGDPPLCRPSARRGRPRRRPRPARPGRVALGAGRPGGRRPRRAGGRRRRRPPPRGAGDRPGARPARRGGGRPRRRALRPRGDGDPPRAGARGPGPGDARLRAPRRGGGPGGHARRARRPARLARRRPHGPPTGPPATGCTWSGASPRPSSPCGWPRTSGSCARPSPRSGPGCATAPPARGGPSWRRSCSATGRPRGPPRVAARALAVLAELGLVTVTGEGVRAAARPRAPRARGLGHLPRLRGAAGGGPAPPRPGVPASTCTPRPSGRRRSWSDSGGPPAARRGIVHICRRISQTSISPSARPSPSSSRSSRRSPSTTPTSTATRSAAPTPSPRSTTARRCATPASPSSRTRSAARASRAGLGLDGTAVVAALLHDTVEDTSATLEEIEAGLRRRDRRPRGRRHQALEDPLREPGGPPGRELPQADRLDVERHPRAGGEAGRPPPQHAHAGLHDQAEADPEGQGDARDLRAAGPPARHPLAQVGAGGPGLRHPPPAALQRDPADGQPAPARPRGLHRGRRADARRPRSRTSGSSGWRSPGGRSTSTRSTRR